ncbi:helix-turn-helix domain-containing protein [Schaalia sp. ZJ1691]|uniref:helix-turn-helix domain-containing protein n=1 Tax=Schaalia sp. ZJ1691 TaxID=2709404 RepID=UPI0013EB120E|nr:helix-turn-helix domain-containing protein [Schaalia sp. ZJ1691]
MEDQNLRFLQDAFLNTHKMCSWTLTVDGQLVYFNSLDQELFFNLFMLGDCSSVIRKHFTQSDIPIIVADQIGFVWVAVYQKSVDDQQDPLVHVLGPIIVSEVTEKQRRQRIQELGFTPDFEERLLSLVREVPTVLENVTISCTRMLHYCTNDEVIESDAIVLWNESAVREEDIVWGDARWHGTWLGEQRFFKSVVEGSYDGLRELAVGHVGGIGGGDPLRQAKNEVIILSVFCSRGAIMGGVSSEGALNLSDNFIQNIEAAETVAEVRQIGGAMHRAFIDRVRLAKANQGYSPLVRMCVDYVETHIFERIRIRDLVQEVGYAENYISRRFKAEMGQSLVEYINQQKVEVAKSMLKGSMVSVVELSERLSFSNPSYFSAVFKKHTGLTPLEYRKK